MGIIKAYVLPHPPLAVPEVGRGKEAEIKRTLEAFDEVAAEIAGLAPETIIYITPHNVLYADYFHISPGTSANGDLSRFGAPATTYMELDYDVPLVTEIERLAERSGIAAGTLGEKSKTLDHGFTVPAWFVNRRYGDYKAVRISQSGMEPAMHYRFGQIIAEAAEAIGRKAVLIASADLSHKLSDEGPYGFAPEGAEFDGIIVDILSGGDFLSLFTIPDALRDDAAECGYNSLTIMAGCFDRRNVNSKLLSYEGPFGVGYAVASIEPGEPANDRDILEQFKGISLSRASKSRDAEDDYRALARRSLEHMIENCVELPLPGDLPDELLEYKAGVFVSLHKNGSLRGCIGTISPTTDCVAREIIQNAVSAGLNDSRFEPVSASELPYLTYKVDVLSAPEPISSPEELDVKRYGVIVTSGYKRGLLLPNLDGVNTVAEQISIAKSKAGISGSDPIKLERFEVVRHE